MKHFYFIGFVVALLLVPWRPAHAQDTLQNLPARYLDEVTKKTERVSRLVEQSAENAVSSLLKQEKKLRQKIGKVNPEEANRIFNRSIDSLTALQQAIKTKMLRLSGKTGKPYLPYLDTLQGTLKYLDQHQGLLAGGSKQLTGVLGKVDGLQNTIANSAQIEDFIKSRKDALTAELSGYAGLGNELAQLNKTVYYYGQQLNDYKEIIADRKKAEKKAREILSNSKVYKDFLAKNSILGSLFSLPSANTAQQIEGLQTRSVVEETIKKQIGNSPQAKQAVSQAMDKAQQEFAKYKAKLPDLKSAGDMPGFKPNPMKGKTFFHRLELGGNLQFRKTTQYFPSTAEIAGQLAYKLNDKSSAGLGLSYTCGTGTGWDHIKFTHHSVGIRSFMDWKLKGSIYINGGIEGRYISTIRNLNELKAWNRWQPSALLGLSKKYKVSPKIKGNVQLLYDFMATAKMPRQNPIVIRFGYTK